ncbi:hypothetical protein ABZZ20_19580 [Streptomyces sp. NPDC006430]|uniref:hypothetical protein n=1 Tax=Streptomyces sp. NPDC006430 TaxID=3154299 RepID=UPI0033A2969F
MHRITRYSIPAALCVTLLTASPGLAGAANAPAKPAAPVAKKSVPGTEALLSQVQSLGSAGQLLTPVSDLLAAVLKSPDGKLPDAELAAHKQKINAALADVKETFAAAAPAAPTTPEAPAKPPAEVAKPPAEVAKPPVHEAKPPVHVVKPPVHEAKPPAEVAKPPVHEAKPPVHVVKPPVHEAKPPAEVAKPPAAVAKPVTLPAAAPLAAPVAAAVKAEAGSPLDLVSAAVDRLKVSVDVVTKAAGPCNCTIDAKAKATDVVNDMGATMVALFTGLGLPGMPAAAPAPAVPAPAAPVE